MEKFGWWIDMLLLASFEDNKSFNGNRLTEVKRGQFIASLRFLAERWKVSKDKVNAFLKILIQEGMIIRESDKNETLITICNYDSYQDNSDDCQTPSRHLQDTSETPSRQTKEIKEVIVNNNISTTRTRETVRDYAARYVSEGMWIPMACQKTHRKKEVVLAWLDEFVMMLEHNEEQKEDFKDFKDHFWNHIGRRAELERQAERKTGDGSDKRQQDTDRRRGVPAVARTREEYQKPF